VTNFRDYATYYDLVNRGKDYATECGFITSLLCSDRALDRGMLELGCGTGGHAIQFANQGIPVQGIDISEEMLRIAMSRSTAATAAATAGATALCFEQGDARSYRAGRKFDAVLSLFHVVSYQTANQDLADTFETARVHLDPGGRFMFDFWYGPAVLSDRPRIVERVVASDDVEVNRRTTPTMRVNDNCVDVHFDITVTSKSSRESVSFAEDHHMRYLFLPELRHMLGRAGFSNIEFRRWLSSEEPSDTGWYACCIAEAI